MVETETSAAEDGGQFKTFFLLRYVSKIDYPKTNGAFVVSVMEPACESHCLPLFFLENFDKTALKGSHGSTLPEDQNFLLMGSLIVVCTL